MTKCIYKSKLYGFILNENGSVNFKRKHTQISNKNKSYVKDELKICIFIITKSLHVFTTKKIKQKLLFNFHMEIYMRT